MFHEDHHRSMFPLIVTALTLGLILVLVLLFGPVVRDQSRGLIGRSEIVGEEAYERNVSKTLTRFEERMVLSESDSARYDIISTTTSDVLDLVVPSTYQDVHLNLVIALDTLRQGYNLSDSVEIQKGEEMLESLRTQYPWL